MELLELPNELLLPPKLLLLLLPPKVLLLLPDCPEVELDPGLDPDGWDDDDDELELPGNVDDCCASAWPAVKDSNPLQMKLVTLRCFIVHSLF